VDGLNVVEPMTQMSRLLVERLLKEISVYFNKTSGDELVCMFLNPFVLIFGMDYLVGQRILPKELKENCRNEVVNQAVDYFGPDKAAIFTQLQQEEDEAHRAAAEQAAVQPGVAAIVPGSPARIKGRVFQQMQKRMASLTASATPTVNLPIEERQNKRYSEERKKFEDELRREILLYEEYFESFISDVTDDGLLNDTKWMELIFEFPSSLASKEIVAHSRTGVPKLWRDNFCPMDAVYSSKRFDIVRWWMEPDHGGAFKYLQALTVMHLSQPYTNALVERVFSRGTWIDGARSQRTLDATFEMRVLDADNRPLVEFAKPMLDINDQSNKDDARQAEITTRKIGEALARFAEPLDSSGNNDEEKDDDDDDDEQGKEVVVVAGIDSEEDSEEDDEDDDTEEQEATVFNDMRDSEFHSGVNEVLRHMASSRKKPPPSAVNPRSSAKVKSSRKSA
jgi:hypothetical protein